jgi:hypothetical protein
MDNLILPTVAVAAIKNINAQTDGGTMSDCCVGGNAANPINLIQSNTPITVQQNFQTFVDVKFGNGTPFENEAVVPTLTQIAGIVSHALDEFESLIRQSA